MSDQLTHDPPGVSPWRGRDFRLVWGGGFVNDVGDWLLLVALPVLSTRWRVRQGHLLAGVLVSRVDLVVLLDTQSVIYLICGVLAYVFIRDGRAPARRP